MYNFFVKDVPGPPTGPLEITDVGRYSVSLSWKPPKDDGGSPIQSYTVEQRQANRRMWTPVSNYITNIPFTISGLSEKIEYEFRVCAENFNGVGPALHGTEPVVIVAPYSKIFINFFLYDGDNASQSILRTRRE